MIAMPIDTKESTIILQLYGNSPYFAFLNEESEDFNVLENKDYSNISIYNAITLSLPAFFAL